LPDDVMGAARELAGQLRRLVDREGLTLRRLAADDEVPYGVPALRSFFSGRSLPPSRLVEVIADRCGGDRELLLSTLDRAIAARDAGLPWAAGTTPRPRSRPSLRGRPGLLIAAVAGFVVGTNALTAVAVARLTDRPSHEPAAARTQPASSRAHPPNAAQAVPLPPAPRRPSRGDQPAPWETSGSLIRNGAFTGTAASWWPVSDVRIRADVDRLRADARGGSTDPSDRIVSTASFPLRAGRTYRLTFDAAAGADVTDHVTVQLDQQPFTAAISRRIELTTSMRRFSYLFAANLTTDQAALNFELGGHPGDHTIWLDNVTLAPA
jgi:hypothetical protein